MHTGGKTPGSGFHHPGRNALLRSYPFATLAQDRSAHRFKKYHTAFTSNRAENEKLKRKNKKFSEFLDEANHESMRKKINGIKLQREYKEATPFWSRGHRKF